MRSPCVLFMLLLMVSAEAADPAPRQGLPSTPEAIDARISEIEFQLIEEQAKRYRAKHALEYGDTNVAPIYAEAKQLEKQVAEVKQQLDDALRVADPAIRQAESRLKASWKQRNEAQQLGDAIRRELSSIGNTATNGQDTASLVANLEAELALIAEQTGIIDERIRQDQQDLDKRKAEATASNPEWEALQRRYETLKADHQARFGELHQTMDAAEVVRALDERRMELARELQLLKEQRKKLTSSTSETGLAP